MIETLTFDIETVPQEGPLSSIQEEELDKKISRYLNRYPEKDSNDVKNLLMGTSPYFGEIIVIGLYKTIGDNEESMAITGSEEEILSRFWEIVRNHKSLFISYNGLSFDIPFILKRSMKFKIKPTNPDFLITRRFSKYPHFDVKEVISDFDKFAAPSLHLACDLMGVKSPKEGEVKAEDVHKVYKEKGGLQKIADYCIRDVKATYEVFKGLQGYYK